MTRPALKLLASSILLVTAITLTTYVALRRLNAGLDASVEHKSAKHATATVASVTPVPKAEASDSANNSRLFRVCFTIDDFDQVGADERARYQSAESRRLARDGPRCKVTSKASVAETLNKGSKLSVTYLLENDDQIDLVTITVHGEHI
jgi:hypothetical protein